MLGVVPQWVAVSQELMGEDQLEINMGAAVVCICYRPPYPGRRNRQDLFQTTGGSIVRTEPGLHRGL